MRGRAVFVGVLLASSVASAAEGSEGGRSLVGGVAYPHAWVERPLTLPAGVVELGGGVDAFGPFSRGLVPVAACASIECVPATSLLAFPSPTSIRAGVLPWLELSAGVFAPRPRLPSPPSEREGGPTMRLLTPPLSLAAAVPVPWGIGPDAAVRLELDGQEFSLDGVRDWRWAGAVSFPLRWVFGERLALRLFDSLVSWQGTFAKLEPSAVAEFQVLDEVMGGLGVVASPLNLGLLGWGLETTIHAWVRVSPVAWFDVGLFTVVPQGPASATGFGVARASVEARVRL